MDGEAMKINTMLVTSAMVGIRKFELAKSVQSIDPRLVYVKDSNVI